MFCMLRTLEASLSQRNCLGVHWLRLSTLFVNECLQRLEECVLMRLPESWPRDHMLVLTDCPCPLRKLFQGLAQWFNRYLVAWGRSPRSPPPSGESTFASYPLTCAPWHPQTPVCMRIDTHMQNEWTKKWLPLWIRKRAYFGGLCQYQEQRGVSREGSLVQHSSVLRVGSKFASLTSGHLFQEYLSTARFGKKFPGDKHLNPLCATKLKAWNDYIKIPCKAHMTSS